MIYDVNCVPFSFLFDESTNNQVKKQYGYVWYWSPRFDQIVSTYADSLFVGHCNPDDLVEQYNHFVDKLELSTFDLHDFFKDLNFFFKLSSARWENYASLENVTNIVAQYAKKHVETWWLSMKYVALRLLEQ